MTDALPCPFCGVTILGCDANTDTRWVWIGCRRCGARGPDRALAIAADTSTADAIVAWNHRVPVVPSSDDIRNFMVSPEGVSFSVVLEQFTRLKAQRDDLLAAAEALLADLRRRHLTSRDQRPTLKAATEELDAAIAKVRGGAC